jgi:hypothetical protein
MGSSDEVEPQAARPTPAKRRARSVARLAGVGREIMKHL